MLVRADGSIVGTIGGGMVERKPITAARNPSVPPIPLSIA
ncbi:XdhC family protein [Escherichia coli]|nr:XdhC family protein [Escherichia coli]